jgi:hypothetical protein
MINRALHQTPHHAVPSAKVICRHGEIYKYGENF